MGTNETWLAKSKRANHDAVRRTSRVLVFAAVDLNSTAADLKTVGSEPGLEGMAGDAAAEAFVQLSRDCAQLADDMGVVANAGAKARMALDEAATAYDELPPVALTAGQRAQVAEAYATQGQVYVPGRGMLSPWAAEQVWLQAARARS